MDVEELNRKRKRDKANADIENKALKKRLGGVFDNSDLVLKGLEHLSGVLAALLESNRMQVPGRPHSTKPIFFYSLFWQL